ncbi:hypothetical protein AHF37_01379 [Paragonimus kellicotti]|nr:hypothetical protein AHF37_01379 [Paragonimus kellicotti]
MPGSVKVRVLSARNLPIMDRSTLSTDAFVEFALINQLDDRALQEEVLLLKVMDHDTYSAHDTIGRVYFDLNPLLNRGQSRSLSGWFPIYDTMHGIRGEISLTIRVDVFLDTSRYHQSSIGVRFFYSELQRKMGLKVLNLGGNSVIGYQLHFDLEGETGVVVRGIGTAVRLRKLLPTRSPPTTPVPPASKIYGSAEVKTGSPIEFSESPMLVEWELPNKGQYMLLPGIQFRDAWWLELRTEIVQHMHSLHCTAVMGYREECTIYEDVCILSNYGTAVVLDTQFVRPLDRTGVRETMRPVGTQDLVAALISFS